MIYYEVEAGLCNRLRGMIAAYYFARDTKQELTVIWESDVNCNVKFSSIFKIDKDVPLRVIEMDCMGNTIKDKMEHAYNRQMKKIMRQKCRKIHECDLREEDINRLKEEAVIGDIYLKCNSYWYDVVADPFGVLHLRKDIEDKCKKLVERCGKNGVGVHIRRTDHQFCIDKSPTEAFIREMKKESDSACFYVATDDISEIEKLQNIFGGDRIIYNKDAELKRDTEQGIEDAVIDLYVLAGMTKILGSEGSSFTDMAGMIHNIPVIKCI